MFYKIKRWWRWEGKYLPGSIKESIQKLCYWFTIIWKDRDWDQHYIYEVLKHKLKAQAKYIGDRDFYTRAQQDARNMRICVSLIEKLQDETYETEYLDYCKEADYTGYLKKYPLIYKKVLKGEGPWKVPGEDVLERDRFIAMNIAHINHNRLRKLLFKILESEIEKWWD